MSASKANTGRAYLQPKVPTQGTAPPNPYDREERASGAGGSAFSSVISRHYGGGTATPSSFGAVRPLPSLPAPPSLPDLPALPAPPPLPNLPGFTSTAPRQSIFSGVFERAVEREEQETYVNRTITDIGVLLPTDGMGEISKEDRIGQVEDLKSVAQMTTRLIYTDDEDAQAAGFALLANYGYYLRPFFEEEGVDLEDLSAEAVASDVNLDEYKFDYMPKMSWWQKAGGWVIGQPGVEEVLRFLDRTSQFSLNLQQAGMRIGTPGALNPREVLSDTRNFLDVRRQQDEIQNYREMMGMDPNTGGRWAGLADTAAVIATDPLTYVTFGLGGASTPVRQGTQAAIRRFAKEGAEDAARLFVARNGMKGIARKLMEGGDDVIAAVGKVPQTMDEAMDYVRAGVKEELEATFVGRARQAALLTDDASLRKKLLRGIRSYGASFDDAGELIAGSKLDRKVLSSLRGAETGGRAGVRFFGRYTVLPYGNLATGFGLRDTYRYVMGARPLSKMGDEGAEAVEALFGEGSEDVLRRVASDATTDARTYLDDIFENTHDVFDAAGPVASTSTRNVTLPGMPDVPPATPGRTTPLELTTGSAPGLPATMHPAYQAVAALHELASDPALQKQFGVTADEVAKRLRLIDETLKERTVKALPERVPEPLAPPSVVTDSLGRFQAARRSEVLRQWNLRHGNLGKRKQGQWGSPQRPWFRNTGPLSPKERAGRWSGLLDEVAEKSWTWAQLRRRLQVPETERTVMQVVDDVEVPTVDPVLDPFQYWRDTGKLHLQQEDLIHALSEISLPNTSSNRNFLETLIDDTVPLERSPLLDRIESEMAGGVEEGLRMEYATYTREILEQVFRTKAFTDAHLKAMLASAVDWSREVVEQGLVPWGASVSKELRDLSAYTTMARIIALNPGLLDAVPQGVLEKLMVSFSDLLSRVDVVTGSLDDPSVKALLAQVERAGGKLDDPVLNAMTDGAEATFAIVRDAEGSALGAARFTTEPLTRDMIDAEAILSNAPRELEGEELARYVQGQLAAVMHGITGLDDDLTDLISQLGDEIRRGGPLTPTEVAAATGAPPASAVSPDATGFPEEVLEAARNHPDLSSQALVDQGLDYMSGAITVSIPPAYYADFASRFPGEAGTQATSLPRNRILVAFTPDEYRNFLDDLDYYLGDDGPGQALTAGQRSSARATRNALKAQAGDIDIPAVEQWRADRASRILRREVGDVPDEVLMEASGDAGEYLVDRINTRIGDLLDERSVTQRRVAAAVWLEPGVKDDVSSELAGQIVASTGRLPEHAELWGIHEIFRMLTASADPDEIRRIVRLLQGEYEWERALNGGVPPKAIPPSTGPGGVLDTRASRVVRRAQAQGTPGVDVNFRADFIDDRIPTVRGTEEAIPLPPAPASVREISDFGEMPDVRQFRAAQDAVARGTALRPDALQLVPEKVRTGMLDAAKRSPFWRWIERSFVPRALMRHGGKGDNAATQFYRAQSAARVELDVAHTEALMRLAASWKHSLSEWSGSEESFYRYLNEVLSGGKEVFSEARAAAVSRGQSRLVQALDTLHDVRVELHQAALKAGADPKILRDVDSYIPHVRTTEAMDKEGLIERTLEHAARDGADDLLPGLGLDDAVSPGRNLGLSNNPGRFGIIDTDNFLRERKLFKGTDNVFETNQDVVGMLKRYGVDLPKMFEDNPFKAFAMRSRSAFAAATQADLFTALHDIVGPDGIRLAYVSAPNSQMYRGADGTLYALDADVFRAGLTLDDVDLLKGKEVAEAQMRSDGAYTVDFLEDETISGFHLWVDRTLKPDLDQVRSILYNDEQLENLAKFFDEWSNTWGIYATVPLVGGLGFPSRNATGNIASAYYSGLRNPARISQAFNLQRDFIKVRRHMNDTGVSWEAAAKAVDLGDDTVSLLRQMREDGVLNLGFFDNLDYGAGAEAMFGMTKLSEKAAETFKNNWITRSGKWFNSNVEDNARIAVYIDEMAKSGDRNAAVERIQKYLFDYRDLTNAEAKLRRVSRFYTWMRKNTAMQLATLTTMPGRVINAERMSDALLDFIYPPEEGKEGEGLVARLLPDWAVRSGMIYRAGPGGMVGVETPFESAFQTLHSLLSIPQIVPIIRENMPEYLRHEDGQAATREALQLLSGGPVSATTFLYEQGTGVDTFTGGEADSGWRLYLAMADAVAPIGGKFVRTGERIDNMLSEKDGYALELGTLLGGLQTYRTDSPERQLSLLNSVRAQVMRVLEEAEERGVDIPTIEELRADGTVAQVNWILRSRFEENPMILLNQIPPSIRETFGLEVTEKEVAEMSELEREQGITELILYVEEAIGRELSNVERQTLAFNSPYSLNRTEQEALGIAEPRENVFLKESPEAEDLNVEYLQANLAALERGAGLPSGYLLANNPIVPEAIRVWNDAINANVSKDELLDYVITELLSREKIWHLFGEDQAREILDMTRTREVTAEDYERTSSRAQELAAEYVVVGRALGLPLDEVALRNYVVGMILTVDQEERVNQGERILPKGPPPREDISTRAEKDDEARTLRDAGLEGMSSYGEWLLPEPVL